VFARISVINYGRCDWIGGVYRATNNTQQAEVNQQQNGRRLCSLDDYNALIGRCPLYRLLDIISSLHEILSPLYDALGPNSGSYYATLGYTGINSCE